MAEGTSSPSTLDYQSGPPQRQLRMWALILAFPAPTLLQAAFITLMEWPKRNVGTVSGWPAILLAIAGGVGLLVASRWRPRAWLPVLLLYVLLQLGWLVLFSLEFACAAFGDCP